MNVKTNQTANYIFKRTNFWRSEMENIKTRVNEPKCSRTPEHLNQLKVEEISPRRADDSPRRTDRQFYYIDNFGDYVNDSDDIDGGNDVISDRDNVNGDDDRKVKYEGDIDVKVKYQGEDDVKIKKEDDDNDVKVKKEDNGDMSSYGDEVGHRDMLSDTLSQRDMGQFDSPVYESFPDIYHDVITIDPSRYEFPKYPDGIALKGLISKADRRMIRLRKAAFKKMELGIDPNTMCEKEVKGLTEMYANEKAQFSNRVIEETLRNNNLTPKDVYENTKKNKEILFKKRIAKQYMRDRIFQVYKERQLQLGRPVLVPSKKEKHFILKAIQEEDKKRMDEEALQLERSGHAPPKDEQHSIMLKIQQQEEKARQERLNSLLDPFYNYIQQIKAEKANERREAKQKALQMECEKFLRMRKGHHPYPHFSNH